MYYGRHTHTSTFKNMLVQVPPKCLPKIHDFTSQKTACNLVCCYVYNNLINVRLYFYVLLTVRLSTVLAIGQLNAQILVL